MFFFFIVIEKMLTHCLNLNYIYVCWVVLKNAINQAVIKTYEQSAIFIYI